MIHIDAAKLQLAVERRITDAASRQRDAHSNFALDIAALQTEATYIVERMAQGSHDVMDDLPSLGFLHAKLERLMKSIAQHEAARQEYKSLARVLEYAAL